MIVLDSDVLIALLKRNLDAMSAVRRWHQEGETLATTTLNMAEVLRGLSGRKLAEGRHLLAGLVLVPFGPRAATRYGRFMHTLDRLGQPTPVVDSLVAAATLEAGARLATWNVRDFDRILGLELVAP